MNFVKFISLVIFVSLFPMNSIASAVLISHLNKWCTDSMEKWNPSESFLVSVNDAAYETVENRGDRYEEIARSAYQVAFDRSETPLFEGPDARSKTLALLLVTASSESQFMKNVDFGHGPKSVGDNGKSWCLMQVRLSKLGKSGHTKVRFVLDGNKWKYAYDGKSGWGGEDLIQDRKKCFRAGLHILRTSIEMCSKKPAKERLSGYISGSCDSKIGRFKSISRIKRMNAMLSTTPPIAEDQIITDLVQSEFKPKRYYTSQGEATASNGWF